MNMRRGIWLVCLLLFVWQARAEAQAIAARGNVDGGAAASRYHYLFENSRFTIPRIEVEFDGAGQGKYLFKRKEGDEIDNKLAISPALLGQIRALFIELNFLDSNENYQHKKDFSHLGTITITYERGGRKRSASFNYTDNAALNRLAEIFRNIATREMRIFELENIRQSDPISTPAQMRLLESELRGKHIADPPTLIPLLKDIKQDEGVPLIARNHADRLIQLIQKGKI
jgi:hypothetical protein